MRMATLNHDLEYQIIREKHQLLPSIMKDKEIDCWIIYVRETETTKDPIMEFVVGGEVVWTSGYIFHLSPDGKFTKTAMVGNFDVAPEQQKNIWDNVLGYTEGIGELIKAYIDKINPKKIGLNYSQSDFVADGLSHGMFLNLSAILEDKKDRIVSAEPIVVSIRGRKTETELKLIRETCELTEEINRRITEKIKPGLTELDIYDMFQAELVKEGVDNGWRSSPAVDAGPTKVIGHAGASELLTNTNSTLHNDFGIRRLGYCSDLQRMWYFGKEKEIPEELHHAFNTVKTAIRKASKFIKPGVQGWEVDKIARDYVVAQGYKEFGHGLGHAVGRSVHDGGTTLAPLWERHGDTPKGIVEENNVFTLELHVATKNQGYVSLEEMIRVTKDGCEFIVPPLEEMIIVTN